MLPFHVSWDVVLNVCILLQAKVVLLILVGFAITTLFKRSNASFQHLIWVIGFCVLALLPVLHLSNLQWTIPGLQWNSAKIFGSNDYRTQVDEPVIEDSPTVLHASANMSFDDAQESPTYDHSAALISFQQIPTMIGLLWFIGAGVLFIRLCVGHLFIWRLRHNAVHADADILKNHIDTLSGHSFSILMSQNISTPLSFGVIRPCIVLPATFTTWTNTQQRSALLHEAAHLRRFDTQTQLLVNVVCTLYWFNPLVWIANRRQLQLREAACDQQVLDQQIPPHDYANLLVDIAYKSSFKKSLIFAAIPMAKPSNLEGRILSILNHSRKTLHLSPKWHRLLGFVLLCSFVSIAAYSMSTDNSQDNPHLNVSNAQLEVILPALRDALQDKDDDVQEEALELLLQIHHKGTIELLEIAATSEFNHVRRDAIKGLLARGESRWLHPFLKDLKSEDPHKRQTAAQEIRKMRAIGAIPHLINAWRLETHPDTRRELLETLADLRHPDTIPIWQELIRDSHQNTRKKAAWALGEIKSDKAIPVLLPLLQDRYSGVRKAAIESLGDLRAKQAIPDLRMLLQDKDWQVRRETIKVLFEIDPAKCFTDIQTATQDAHYRVRQQALELLGKTGRSDALVPIALALKDENRRVREQAADALGDLLQE